MSIPSKVVSDAAVLCDSFGRSEMRMRFIFTRVSFLLPGTAEAAWIQVSVLLVKRGWGRFRLNTWWGGASFRVSGGGGEVSLGFSTT